MGVWTVVLKLPGHPIVPSNLSQLPAVPLPVNPPTSHSASLLQSLQSTKVLPNLPQWVLVPSPLQKHYPLQGHQVCYRVPNPLQNANFPHSDTQPDPEPSSIQYIFFMPILLLGVFFILLLRQGRFWKHL